MTPADGPLLSGKGWSRRALFALPFAGGPALACEPVRVTTVPLRLVDGFPVVSAGVAGQAASFILDTGAEAMLVTPAMAEALRLPLAGVAPIYGTGGQQEARVVLLPGLRLGGAAMPDQLSPVAPLPVELRTDPPLAGLLGAALLSRFDLDLDVLGRRVSLWSPGCGAPFAGTALPLEVSRGGRPYLVVRVNGRPLLALLDTGSRATLLDEAAARRLGVGAPVSANTARGVDGARLPLEHTRVMLGLGDGGAARETPVSVTPLRLDRGEMLLGLDVLGRGRVWVGYGRGEIRFKEYK